MSAALVTPAGSGPLDTDPELEAAWTAAAVLGARPVRRDGTGAPDMTHDFDLHVGGRTIALEVTRMSVPEVVEMWEAIANLDWAFPELAFNWSISLHSAGRGQLGPRVRQFHAKAPRLLTVIEREGCERSDDLIGGNLEGWSESMKAAITELRRLGARSGNPAGRPNDGDALILVGTSGAGGSVDGSDVNAGVERALEDNLEKLLAAEGDERHLFVWVDSTDPGASVSMWTYAKARPPDLPEGVDCVWVGLWQGNVSAQTHAFTLWRARHGAPWEILDLPAVRDYANSTGAG